MRIVLTKQLKSDIKEAFKSKVTGFRIDVEVL